MNLPNKITISRIILSIIVLILLIFPLEKIGINLPTLIISGKVQVNIIYFICGFLFNAAAVQLNVPNRLISIARFSEYKSQLPIE